MQATTRCLIRDADAVYDGSGVLMRQRSVVGELFGRGFLAPTALSVDPFVSSFFV